MSLTRGERFKDARNVYNQHGKQSMSVVSKATDIHKSLIQALEDDESERSVGYDKVVKLAKHYHVTTDFLLGLSDDPAPMRSAVDELGLSPKVIDRIKKINSQTSSDCNPIAKINRLLEDEEVWALLFEIHDYITAVKADSIYESILAEGYTQEEISAKIQEVADTYKDTDIDMFDFLTAKAHSHSSRPLIRLGLEESSICDLISMRINHQLYRLLLNIEKEETHGID